MNKIFIKVILIAACVLTIFSTMNAQKNAYSVFIDGKKVITEEFDLEKMSDGEIKLTTSVGESKTLTVEKNSKPQSFSIEQQNTKVLSVNFENGTAKISTPGQSEKLMPTKAEVILENSVWSQYILLLAKYDSAKSAKQNFRFFLPSLVMELGLTIQKMKSRKIIANGKEIAVDDYEIVSEGLKINLVANTDKIPLLIEIPSQKVRVVSKDFETEIEKLTPVEKKIFNQGFTSEEVSFPNDKISLGGTLTIPKPAKKTFPAAIIITGSGAQDRDGASGGWIYKNIAESLTKAGIAVLRIDDRGIGKSAISKEQAATPSYFDLISDTRAAIDFLSKRADIDQSKIMLVGHSEGVGTALYLASQDKRVAAIALLAGLSISIDKAIAEQTLYQGANRETVEMSNWDQSSLLKIFADAKLPENAQNPKFAYFREHLNFNPLELTQKVKQPVLILQGERDPQVLAYHAITLAKSLVKSGNKNISLRIIPNVGHLFNSTEDAKTSEEMLYSLQIWADKILKP